MNKAVVTGLNGTIAPYLKMVLEQQGFEVIPFDRTQVDTASQAAIDRFLDSVQPTHLYHLATGPVEWQVQLAEYAHRNTVKFVFTSTESVFSDANNGPYPVDKTPDATSDYGRYKIELETRIQQANPNAYILRLGWQLGDRFEKNNILAFLENTHRENGRIEASSRWIPATAFIGDTAQFIYQVPEQFAAGVYHLNGNPGISFYELVQLINRKYHKHWTIVETDTPARDGRIVDSRIPMPPLTAQFDTDAE